jgi:hypothetical protein
MLPSFALLAFALLPAVQGLPTNSTATDLTSTFNSTSLSSSLTGPKGCGQVALYYDQQPEGWDNYHTGSWLNNWWDTHQSLMSNNSAGFAGAFGQWGMGNPDWSCQDDGSNSNCDLELCNNRVLNSHGNSTRQTYYVLESVNRLHSYFLGLEQAFSTAALDAALSKESWATTFYTDPDASSVTALKEVLSGLSAIISIGASFATFAANPITKFVTGAAGAAMTGALNVGNNAVTQQYVLLLLFICF